MTLEELAALPVGSLVTLKHDDGNIETGELLRAGTEVWIMWPESECTQVIDTNSKGWEKFTVWLEAE